VHEYRVAEIVADSAGTPREAVVERTSRSTIAGEGAGGSAGTTVAGTGAARARLTFDLAAGRYTGGAINSATDLTVNVNGRAQRLTQRAATRVTVVGRGRSDERTAVASGGRRESDGGRVTSRALPSPSRSWPRPASPSVSRD
jgi:hypothetical protein